jgi:hypothetical protein
MKTRPPFAGILAILLIAGSAAAEPLRVDVNAVDNRADMRTVGWENWHPPQEGWKRTFGDLTVTLRAGNGGTLRSVGNKALVVRGVTLGADATVVEGGKPAALEVQLDGLAPGPHTFVGYHHTIGSAGGRLAATAGTSTSPTAAPSTDANHNDELATTFVEFTAEAGKPAVVRFAATEGDSVLLSGFAVDVSDPLKKALKPSPADVDFHADGDDGTVKLSWTPAKGAKSHDVYMTSAATADDAAAKLAAATNGGDGYIASVDGAEYAAKITPNNTSLHYAWRVDTVDGDGHVTRGDAWRFRVRHLAFPTAEGYGRFAIGGRGGRVMHVTSLDDSGPGTLREAVEATGARTVVFDVSGLISLESRLVFKPENAYLTVAGQTAPGKGITLRGHTFGGIGGQDVILRFVRMRMGNLVGGRDGMGFASSDNCIIDHCSISWTIDEAFSSRGAKNITFQRNLISESLNPTGHGFAGSIGGDIGSFHHSLLANNAGRNFSLAGAVDTTNRHAGRLDLRNIVVYNWGHRTTDGGAREVNFVNNYYKPGPASDIKVYLRPQFENPAFGPQQYYVEGNVVEGVAGPEGPEGPFKGMAVQGQQDAPVTVPEPFFPSYVKTHTAEEAYENVLADVGCNVPTLDDHDKRIINEVRTGTTTYKGSRSGLPGLPDHQDDVGAWEEYPEIRRPADWDADRDGMPSAWEVAHKLDPNDPADGAADPDGDGFTNLENYLNELAATPVTK